MSTLCFKSINYSPLCLIYGTSKSYQKDNSCVLSPCTAEVASSV
uniref:Uncharacterized protein n=1 Tax=Arundo donax TaxID=35708 RepID=A0A0A9SRW5_ARUDO